MKKDVNILTGIQKSLSSVFPSPGSCCEVFFTEIKILNGLFGPKLVQNDS